MAVDLTLPLEEGMLSFPGYPSFEHEAIRTYEADGKRSQQFTATSHSGTHVDAPAHFIRDGATIDEIELATLRGRTKVIDLRDHSGSEITASVLEANAPSVGSDDRVLLVTGDVDSLPHTEAFFERAAMLTADGAEWLVDRGVRLVANDFLTEATDAAQRPVHHTLLGAGIPIVEYLRNTDAIAEDSEISFTCLPLQIPGFEAAPARAVAERDPE